jgi:hypothetical protein
VIEVKVKSSRFMKLVSPPPSSEFLSTIGGLIDEIFSEEDGY